MAGSMGMTGELKVGRLREMALRSGCRSSGCSTRRAPASRRPPGSLFAGSGHLFREEVVMSGVIPMVAAMLGPCAAGTAYIPGLSDFVPMVVGQGAMALAGPHLTKAVTGEDISMEDLGGAKVHCRKSGVGDLEVKDDQECIEVVKDYLSYFPPNCEERPPIRETKDPEDRMSEKLLDIVPESARHPYDMYDVIREIVDDGEIFDIKPKFAKTIITCLARFGGQPCGIVASQPKQLGGILENDSADKAARFVNLCDAFGIPLLFLQDVPGFMVGSKVEHAGIIRHGAKMLYAVSRATVPKITVVVRKAYGAGYYVMNGKAYEPDLIVAWPTAEISVMGAEGAVNIIGRSAIEASDDPEETREEMVAEVRRADRPLHRRQERPDRRRHRPARDAPDDHPRPADGGGQAGRAPLEEARGDAGMSESGSIEERRPDDRELMDTVRAPRGRPRGQGCGRRIAASLKSSTSDVEFVPAIAGGVEGGSTKGHDEFRRFFDDLGRDLGDLPAQVRRLPRGGRPSDGDRTAHGQGSGQRARARPTDLLGPLVPAMAIGRARCRASWTERQRSSRGLRGRR